VAEDATDHWIITGVYLPRADTWPTEIVDLSRHGLTRAATTRINVRDAIVRASLTCLEEN